MSLDTLPPELFEQVNKTLADCVVWLHEAGALTPTISVRILRHRIIVVGTLSSGETDHYSITYQLNPQRVRVTHHH